MNERIERGLRNVLSALAESVEGSSGNRPQQFDSSERTPRSRRRTRKQKKNSNGIRRRRKSAARGVCVRWR